MAKTKEEHDIMNKDVEKEIAVVADVPAAPAEQVESTPLEERVVAIDRVSRTQKGGRRMRFRATVVVGDRNGSVGLGIGKANEITSAVAKATYQAKKNIVTVPIVRHTIPHEIIGKFDTAIVLLKPAQVGTSIIAGGAVRPILELAGVENVVSKCLSRTTNKLNNAYATLKALTTLKDIKEVAPRHYVKAKKAVKPTVKATA
ncbi:MAG TPA: 30S ribosomal protein S5 [Patescibacteria group bacterium]